MMLQPRKVKLLVNGVTGYIGGSILAQLLKFDKTPDIEYELTALVRKKEQGDLLQDKGILVRFFSGLDDLEECRKIANDYDVVIAAAMGTHDESCAAWVYGLSDRQKRLGTKCYYVHTGGSSVVGYLSVLGDPVRVEAWSDKDTFSRFVEKFPETVRYRPNRISFSEIAEHEGVKYSIIVPPTIWGEGLGFFSKMSSQVATLAKMAAEEKQAFTIGQGNGVWNIVHIEDLSELFVHAVRFMVEAESSPNQSIYWCENGTHTWAKTTAAIARTLKGEGVIATEDVREVSVAEGGKLLGNGDERLAVAVYASSSIGSSDLARSQGWNPKHSADDYWNIFNNGKEFKRLYVQYS